MKKIFFVLMLVSIVLTTKAQQTTVVPGVYKWNAAVVLTECDIEGNVLQSAKILSTPKQLFTVIGLSKTAKDSVVIKVLDYTKIKKKIKIYDTVNFFKYNYTNKEVFTTLSTSDKKARNYGLEQRYFLVPKDAILNVATKRYSYEPELAVGVLNMPLKMRLQDGDFSGSVSFSGAGGVKFRASHYKDDRYWNFLIGIGISNINLDSNVVGKNKDKIVTNLTALTSTFGVVYQSGKMQAGIFLGWDFLTKTNQEKFSWNYQGKPWLSLGFGFSLFGNDKNEANSGKETQ